MLAILLAMASMAVRDAVATALTIAEARGRALLAGILDAVGDLATIATTVLGAGTVIKDGVTPHSMVLIGAMLLVSFVGTTLDTHYASRWIKEDKP